MNNSLTGVMNRSVFIEQPQNYNSADYLNNNSDMSNFNEVEDAIINKEKELITCKSLVQTMYNLIISLSSGQNFPFKASFESEYHENCSKSELGFQSKGYDKLISPGTIEEIEKMSDEIYRLLSSGPNVRDYDGHSKNLSDLNIKAEDVKKGLHSTIYQPAMHTVLEGIKDLISENSKNDYDDYSRFLQTDQKKRDAMINAVNNQISAHKEKLEILSNKKIQPLEKLEMDRLNEEERRLEEELMILKSGTAD